MRTNPSGASKFGAFVGGVFFGILIAAVAMLLFMRYFIRNPQTVLSRAENLGVQKVVEKAVEKSVQKTVASIPQDVVAVRQDDINRTVQNLTEAYSENRITPTDMQLIAGKFFGMMADQKITPEEMDEMLRFMNRMTQ